MSDENNWCKAPLAINPSNPRQILDAHNDIIVTDCDEDAAPHIVDCVNACDGFDPKEVRALLVLNRLENKLAAEGKFDWWIDFLEGIGRPTPLNFRQAIDVAQHCVKAGLLTKNDLTIV